MLKVYLLRHGETPWNAQGNKYCGRTDLPLTSRGIRQAEQARELLRGIRFDAVYASPLQRAYETARIASGLAGLVSSRQNVIKDQRLTEADFGEWEGKAKEQFIPENEALWAAWMNDPAATRAGGTGETAADVVSRVDDFFAEALQKHPGGTILVAAHNGVNRFYLAHKLGMPLKNYRKLTLENASVTLFSLEGIGELTLLRLNTSPPG